MCVAAIAIWEAAKAVWRYSVPDLRQDRRGRRLQRLRELAAVATRAELERLAVEAGSEYSEPSHGGDDADGSQDLPPSTPRGTSTPGQWTSPASRRRDAAALTTMPREATMTGQPSSPVPRRLDAAALAPTPHAAETVVAGPSEDAERSRVCKDLLSLFHVEELRGALRKQGLQVSGLKQDLVARLTPCLETAQGDDRRLRPTTRQLKYVLWRWRHQNLHGRVLLKWDVLSRRDSTSEFIAEWKPPE